MDWKDVGGKLANLAPGIGTILGGPVGAGVGLGVKLLANVFGLGDDATPEQVEQAIASDPQAALKLRIAEMDFQVKKRDQDIEQLKVELGDIQSARTRQVESEKATGSRDFNLYFLAWVNVGGFFAVLVAVIVCDMPAGEVAKTALAMLFGALISGYKDVLGYFFGSSKSSADKTQLMAISKNGGK